LHGKSPARSGHFSRIGSPERLQVRGFFVQGGAVRLFVSKCSMNQSFPIAASHPLERSQQLIWYSDHPM